MGLLDSIMGAVSGQVQQQGGLANVLGGLLANNGDMGGLGWAAWLVSSSKRAWAM